MLHCCIHCTQLANHLSTHEYSGLIFVFLLVVVDKRISVDFQLSTFGHVTYTGTELVGLLIRDDKLRTTIKLLHGKHSTQLYYRRYNQTSVHVYASPFLSIP